MHTKLRIVALGLLLFGLLAVSGWAKVDSQDRNAWMGVSTESVTYDMAEKSDLPIEYGAMITDVVADSPADKAGLKQDDIIISLNGAKITDSDDLVEAVEKAQPGDKVELKLYRDGKPMNLSFALGSSDGRTSLRITPRSKQNYSYWFGNTGKERYMGVSLTSLTNQLREYFGVEKNEGVLVNSVEKDSPAERAGLKAGDVLLAVDGRKVTDASEVHELIQDLKTGDKANLTVVRNKTEMKMPVELAERDASDVLSEAFREATPNVPDAPDAPEAPDVTTPSKPRFYFYDRGDNHSFNSEEFQKQMDELREQLKSVRKEVWNSEDFKKQMEQLKEELKNLDLNVKDLEKKVK